MDLVEIQRCELKEPTLETSKYRNNKILVTHNEYKSSHMIDTRNLKIIKDSNHIRLFNKFHLMKGQKYVHPS